MGHSVKIAAAFHSVKSQQRSTPSNRSSVPLRQNRSIAMDKSCLATLVVMCATMLSCVQSGRLRENDTYITEGNNVKEILFSSGEEDCAFECFRTEKCVAWTLRTYDNVCWLKADSQSKGKAAGWITGTKECGRDIKQENLAKCDEFNLGHRMPSNDPCKLCYCAKTESDNKIGYEKKCEMVHCDATPTKD